MKELDKETRKEIVEYCREIITKLNLPYLKDNDVFKNEFLEFLYLTCIETWKKSENYNLTEEMISILFSFKRSNGGYMNEIRKKNIIVKGIDKYDNLIIDENEIHNRTKIENSKN